MFRQKITDVGPTASFRLAARLQVWLLLATEMIMHKRQRLAGNKVVTLRIFQSSSVRFSFLLVSFTGVIVREPYSLISFKLTREI